MPGLTGPQRFTVNEGKPRRENAADPASALSVCQNSSLAPALPPHAASARLPFEQPLPFPHLPQQLPVYLNFSINYQLLKFRNYFTLLK